ncbi:MAG: hypothetical protein IJG54_06190 [Bacteroidales bacterium]|nr:hypothetical protein [Bacteroidales bacterium]
MKIVVRVVFILFLFNSLCTGCLHEYQDEGHGTKCILKLPNQKYITVWKRSFTKGYPIGDVLIIPGKFIGFEIPENVSYIKASNCSILRIMMIENENHSLDNVIFVNEEYSYKVLIKDKVESKIRLYNYSDSAKLFDNCPYTIRYTVDIDTHTATAHVYMESFSFFTITSSSSYR